jgi:hypoxanthine phosphoribosyltransferase
MVDYYKKRHIDYHEYGELISRLTDALRAKSFSGIYAPPRGGLPLGVHLSHNLELPLYVTFQNISDITERPGQPLLLVDDIIDTGKVLKSLAEKMNALEISFFSAALFEKPRSVIPPDISMETIEDDIWIVFPWEQYSEIPNR